jgi:signal transduction histidine kinase/ActR/RegA family two-component response regulator
MTMPPLPGSDDPAGLRTCLRDLVGLLGLPALWSGKEPQATVRLLAETLVEMLSLEACFVTSSFPFQDKPLYALFANGKAVGAGDVAGWTRFIGQDPVGHRELTVARELTPVGELTVARFSLGYYGQSGQIAVGSSRSGFPQPTELILLRSAASLAASGLRTARLTHERERALRAKDEFLAMLGHEMRNPLAPIVAALELMKIKSGGALTPEQTVIERQVGHLTGIVEDLLDVTRITTGKIELKRELLEVHTIVAAALETAQPLMKQRRHYLRCDVPASGLLVNGDARRLAQVVSNLLINAAKYTEPEGRIEIVASSDAGRVSITVSDNGAGIEPALLPHVFDIFQQGKVSIDRSGGGLGIGLSVVESLVSMHGGSVSVVSEGAGKGSAFTVILPLARDAAGSTAPAGSSHDMLARGKERILVVDDNRDAANMMAELLRSLGHHVYVRHAPLDALSLCEEIRPTVAIIDIGLPVISGYELARLIHARFDGAPPRIIAVSGYGQPQDRARSREAGIEKHFTKPVRLDMLASYLQNGSAK